MPEPPTRRVSFSMKDGTTSSWRGCLGVGLDTVYDGLFLNLPSLGDFYHILVCHDWPTVIVLLRHDCQRNQAEGIISSCYLRRG